MECFLTEHAGEVALAVVVLLVLDETAAGGEGGGAHVAQVGLDTEVDCADV